MAQGKVLFRNLLSHIMRGVAPLALVLALIAAFAHPGGAAGTETVRYVLPTGVVGPQGHSIATPVSLRPCTVAPCAEDIVVGSPVFVIGEPLNKITVRFFDDAQDDRVPVTVCVDGDADGICLGTTFGPFCNGFVIWMAPAPAETVVHAHVLAMDETLDMCSASKGYATATWS